MNSTRERVIAVLARVFNAPVEVIAAGASPATVKGWDSGRHVELVVALEDEFGCMFEPEDVPELVSLERIEEMIVRRTASQ